MVKKIMMGVALSALVATSASTLAMAQSYQPQAGSGNIVHKQGGPVASQRFDAFGAYAYAKPAPHHRHVSHDRMERQ